jgi:nitrate reductase NapE
LNSAIVYQLIAVATNYPGANVMAEESDRKTERRAFIFLVVFFAPALSIAIVGGYGFAIWISQIILGPPGV